MRIYKYKLEIVNRQTVAMHAGAKILTVQAQKDNLVLWALVEEKLPENEEHEILIFGTAQPIAGSPGTYIGTVQMAGGALVWHVFEDITRTRIG